MKVDEGRWQNRIRTMGSALIRPRRTVVGENVGGGLASGATQKGTAAALRAHIGTAAFAFRGYDVSNSGRSRELLEHPVYGTVVRAVLDEASEITADAIHEPVNLATYVRAEEATSLENFPLDVAMIVAMELAQIRLLEQFFEIPIHKARLSFGYSIGELGALVFGGMFKLEQLLPIPLALASDCAELAAETSMGILFTRSPVLPEDDVMRLCHAVSSEGHGLIGPSAFLSPNTALLLGQGDTLNRVEKAMKSFLPDKVMLRRNPNHWPPLHTPIVWERNIPNRTAMALYHIEGGSAKPTPSIISCVTGEADYDPVNCRETLIRWTDHPQRLWDAIDGTLAAGVQRVVHVGPSPNLVPATFARLANNVGKQLGNGYLNRMGRGVVSSMNRHTWLGHLLPHKAALLRAPYLENIILEDWLLEQTLS
jgi:[acyl-carrier-protein] S-malonyltransferase